MNKQLIMLLIKKKHIVAHFLRDKYELEDLTKKIKNQKIVVDETCFIHFENKEVLIIGLIKMQIKEFIYFYCV